MGTPATVIDRTRDFDQYFDAVYDELRLLAARRMRGERDGHTLRPTALVHEAYLRLCGRSDITLHGRSHALALMARAMRRVLIDHARRQQAQKRRRDHPWVVLDETIVLDAPDDAIDLERALVALEELDPRAAGFVELRFFGGLSTLEIAELYGVSDRTVRNDLMHARAWLKVKLA